MIAGQGQIPLSGLVGALSYALDIGEGEPPGHAARTCLIGMRLGASVGLEEQSKSDLYYALLLKDAGCSANSAHMAALFGADDRHAKRTSKLVNWARPFPALVWSLRTVAPGRPLRARAERLLAIKNEGEVTRALMQARCDRGAEIAHKLGFSEATSEAIRGLDEHWDGHGQPRRLRGEQIPLLGRILCLAQTAEVFYRERGTRAAYRVASRRSGEWFDPALVQALETFRTDTGFWTSLADPDLRAVEPHDRALVADDDRLDAIADGFAGIVDAKSPWTHRHAGGVGAFAKGIGDRLGLGAQTVRDLGRAAQLHDIGKLGISNRILDKPGPLTEAEFAQVKGHPVLTRRVLERTPCFEELALLASSHHERLDGSGYPLALTEQDLTMPMRVLAVADVYEALTANRPYRHAWSTHDALEIIHHEVPRRLDQDAFGALQAVVEDSFEPPGVPTPEEGHLMHSAAASADG
ncbi:MAG: HD domain-containing protein [Actinomycetota bacterium]|nr:HD domain-containing protein [Actinomycetota bacterium]